MCEQKAYRHSCIATSALFTGNHDLYDLDTQKYEWCILSTTSLRCYLMIVNADFNIALVFSLFNWLSIWMLFVLVIEEQSSEMVLKQVYRVWFRGSPNWIRWPCEHAFLLKQKFTSNKIPAVIEEIRLVPPTCCETRVHRYIEVALDVYFTKTPIWNSVRHHLLVLRTGCVL